MIKYEEEEKNVGGGGVWITSYGAKLVIKTSY